MTSNIAQLHNPQTRRISFYEPRKVNTIISNEDSTLFDFDYIKEFAGLNQSLYFEVFEDSKQYLFELDLLLSEISPRQYLGEVSRIPQATITKDDHFSKLLDFPSFTQPTLVKEATIFQHPTCYLFDNLRVEKEKIVGYGMKIEFGEDKSPHSTEIKNNANLLDWINSLYGNNRSQISVAKGINNISKEVGKKTLDSFLIRLSGRF